MKDYSEPIILKEKSTGHLYVYYRYKENGIWIQKKEKQGINYIKDFKERKVKAKLLQETLTEELKSGWRPGKQVEQNENIPLSQVLENIYDSGKTIYRAMSLRSYRSIKNIFVRWLKLKNYQLIFPHNFTQEMAKDYLKYIIREGVSGRTANNHMSILKRYFNQIKLDKNPFIGIPKFPQDTGKYFAFTDAEAKKLLDLFKYGNENIKPNSRVYYFVQFMFYAGLRRTEVMGLQVRDIGENSIIVHSGIGKKRKQISKPIFENFRPILEEMNLKSLPEDYYIFSYNIYSDEKRAKKCDYITEIHAKYCKEAKIGRSCSLYSWRHYSAIKLYEETGDVDLIKNFLGHSNLSITENYLRSLGMFRKDKFKNVKIKI